MNCKLIKVGHEVETEKIVDGKKEKRKFVAYNFELVFENGHIERVCANEYKKQDGTKVSNYNTLCALASEQLPFEVK